MLLSAAAVIVSPEGVTTVRGYDEFGRVLTTTDGLGHQILTDYDALGRRAAVTDPEGHITRYTYNGLGNQVAVTDANGVRTSYAYDGLNRQIAVVENDDGGPPTADRNVRTEYAYDALGNRLVITNALGYSSTHTTYDALGRPVVVQDALGHETHTRYNALGYRTVVTDANGAVTRYSYDVLNRLTAVQYVSDSVTVQYAYDALGRRTAMTDTLGTTRYEYDYLGRIVSVSDPTTGTVAYGYDLAGNRTQLVYPDGHVVTYTYDADNRPVQVQDWDGGTTSYEYDAAGRLTSTTLPNGVVTTQQYDDADRLLRLTHTAADDTILSDYQYKLDGMGNRLWVTETLTGTTRLITNTYDPLNRLTGSEYSTSERFVYQYDAVGNRAAMTSTTPLSGTVVTTYTYDAANRLSQRMVDGSDIYLYTWSDAGQLTREEWNGYTVRTFSYDAAGRLVKATLPGFTTTFRYDGDGRRLVKAVNGDPVTYTLDYARDVHILTERSITSTRYYLYGERCIGEVDDETQVWSYYLADESGRVRQVTDEGGEVDFAWSYTASGGVLSGPKGPYVLLECPDGVYDWSTGLIFLNGRYFDPMLGIWISLGPFVVLQGRPRGRKRKRRRWVGWLLWMLVVLAVTMMAGCGGQPPVCAPVTRYNGDPRLPGPHDADILDASVIIQPVIGGIRQGRSLGTIVGIDGANWVMYTHNHFDQGNALGVPLNDPAITDIVIYSHDGANQVMLNKVGPAPDIRVDNVAGQRTRLKASIAMLDGTGGFPRIGSPIARIDGAAANVGDQVDIAYFAPAGNVNNQVGIWHTRIVDRPADTGPFPGTVAVLGIPVPRDVLGPGGHGDSGGGLFLNGEHIGHSWNWIFSECWAGGRFIRHQDAFWLAYLNP
jgi:YD repeat-containing protein